MRRAAILITSHLGIVTSAYKTGLLLPFRLSSAYRGVQTRKEYAGTSAVVDLFAVLASLITIAELILFALYGEGLPIPGILLGILFEVVVLFLFILLPSVAVSEELRSRKITFVFHEVFVCAVYAYISFLIWRILLLLVEYAVSTSVQTPGASELLRLIIRIALFVGWFIVLADVLKKTEVVPTGERDLFYSFVARFIFVTIITFGTIGLSFEVSSKILSVVENRFAATTR